LDTQIAQREATDRRQAMFAPPALSAARTFEADPALTGGFKSMSHFATAVLAAQTGSMGGLNLEAAATGYMQNQGSAGEGWLVPPTYSNQVAEIAINEVDLFGMTQPESISGQAAIKPKDETTPWGATGVQATWRSEAASMTASKLALTGEIMQLHELYAFCSATNEVLNDAGMLQNRLTTQAGRAISWAGLRRRSCGAMASGKVTGFMTAAGPGHRSPRKAAQAGHHDRGRQPRQDAGAACMRAGGSADLARQPGRDPAADRPHHRQHAGVGARPTRACRPTPSTAISWAIR
jgi:HK97 family phage major capsid protein